MELYSSVINVSRLRRDLAEGLTTAYRRYLAFLGNQGLNVMVSRDLTDLADFWKRHRGKPGLYEAPNFDRRYWPSAKPANTLLLFLERDGVMIGSVGYRLIELDNPRALQPLSLSAALRGLWYFYETPELAPEPETCECHLDLADGIYGTICVVGALWIDPEQRRRHAYKALGRLGRILCITLRPFVWNWMVAVYRPKNRDLALDNFGISSHHPDALVYRGETLWMATATRRGIIELAVPGITRSLDAPFTF